MTELPVGWGVLGSSRAAVHAIIPSLQSSEQTWLHGVAATNGLPDGAGVGMTRERHRSAEEAAQRLLEDPLVEAVYIALAPPLRAQWARRAAVHGKHVLCEAPLSLSRADAAETVAVCAASGVFLQEASIHRHSRQQQRVRALIRSGDLGDVGLLRVTHTENVGTGHPPCEADGLGSIHRLGVDGIDLACWLLDAVPTSVAATATFHPGTDIDVAAVVTLTFGDDRIAVIDCSTGLAARSSFEVVGTTSTAAVDRPFGSPPLERARTELRLHISGVDGSRTEVFWDANQYLHAIEAFSLRTRGALVPEAPPADQVVINAQVVEACLRSAEGRLPALVS